ncbi:very-long-chain 3-oxoacyl-CoA reductase [Monocercomonoides exilis]|uniref:very-long-chain 3-oxoacyl-CoA reductase n=1 Tax=Monocercomonoides exilis TaxID=2049356 RepID=UPI003559C7AA|nr:very-long-chain 3-oxoacyl-CoA reductase [Monocercomonoides exilis]|eukprot:MONOS_11502.1-p1 / transcript=MONOS_11502.1 / gene=MONOS_11502 / organism=Monocercomonoides_exilis_PA203 / gene_product= very-long-chain 3-oxoacyl-CoA reductase [EC:1.1.1.62 1.1.1.330] / transcript_product= very-long-chain 3-oxoacyl-CoA reductase [EC:1.1.1.62 1.1.1.330] / location=Mono_scaffold00581:10347-11664(+) / protein_length=358 / sequence_SO=supercontig / SO=protein_coding / is_pseudo=false
MVLGTLAVIVGYPFAIYLIVQLCIIIYDHVIVPHFIEPFPLSRWSSSSSPWAIVTGGGSGVGRGFAEQLARRGFNIILLGRSRISMSECQESIRSRSPNVDVVMEEIDFSRPVHEWAQRVEAIISNKDISILVNNVGINTEIPVVYSEHDLAHVQDMIQVNCLAASAMTKIVLPLMKQNGKGGIIFLSSCTGEFASPMMAVYSGTKAYIRRFGEALSEEVKSSHIDVLVLHPYYVLSKMSGFRKPSLLVCTPTVFATCALRYLGRKVVVQPYFPHLCLDVLFSLVPLGLSLRFQLNRMKTVAVRLMRRKNREREASLGSGSSAEIEFQRGSSHSSTDIDCEDDDKKALLSPPALITQ